MATQTQLTDYIPAQVLEREGYVHISDPEKMLAKMDKDYLSAQGYVHSAILRSVKISVGKAAEIADCSATTLKKYIEMGYLAVDAAGQVSLLDAVNFDYRAAKKAESATKTRIDNSR